MCIFLFSFRSFSFSIDDFVCVLAGIVQLICWSGRVSLSFSFNSLNCISGLVYVFLFRRQGFCYNHMTSQPLQICFLFISSCNFNLNACVTSFLTLSGASFCSSA